MGLVNGAKAAIEEFGRNPPSQEVAQARADVCTGRLSGVRCPHNFQGAWRLSNTAARIVHEQRQAKLQLKLRVEGEEHLGNCLVCNCPMFLKVWYNWDTIYHHTSDEDFNKFRRLMPTCWMLKELDQHTHKHDS